MHCTIEIKDPCNAGITIESTEDYIELSQYKWTEKCNDFMFHRVIIKSENLDKLIKYLQIIKEDL